MLSNQVLKALNDQIKLEGDSSAAYLSMASWCEREGLNGCAQFFYDQAAEERMHMMKIIHYINDMDGYAVIPAQDQPRAEYDSIQELFNVVYDQEKKVTAAIYNILEQANVEKDHATAVFLQWYVDEQREEEAQVRTILDKIKLIGTGGQSLYFIDQEVDKLNAEREEAPEEAV